MSPQDLLAQCARRAETVRLTSGAFARTEAGVSVHPHHPAAHSWSLYGLLEREASTPGDAAAALRMLARSLAVDGSVGIIAWANQPGRTRGEVVEALRAAAIATELRDAVWVGEAA